MKKTRSVLAGVSLPDPHALCTLVSSPHSLVSPSLLLCRLDLAWQKEAFQVGKSDMQYGSDYWQYTIT